MGIFLLSAVWEQDLYKVRPELEDIKGLKVLMAILDGKIVYQDENARFISKRGADLIPFSDRGKGSEHCCPK